jgi:hypothetical protein
VPPTTATAKLQVAYLRLLHAAANLTAPSLSLENASMQLAVGFGIAASSIANRSRRPTADFGQGCLLIRGQHFVVARPRLQHHLGVAAIHRGAGQEVSANHLEAIAARLIRAKHQGRRFDRPMSSGERSRRS